MDVPPGFIVSIIREAAAESYRKILTFDKFHISVKNRRRSVDSRAACVVYCTENLYVKGVARMKKTYLGLMGLFLLPQTALAVDAAAPKPAPQPEKAPTPPPAEEKKPAPPAAEKPASPVRETPAPAAPVSQEEKPDELDIDLLLEEIKRM